MALLVFLLILAVLALIVFILSIPSLQGQPSKKHQIESEGVREKLFKRHKAQVSILESELRKEKSIVNLLRDDLEKLIKREADLLNEKKAQDLTDEALGRAKRELLEFKQKLSEREKVFDAEYSLNLKIKKELEEKRSEADLLKKELRQVNDSLRKSEAEARSLSRKTVEQKKDIVRLEKKEDESNWISKKEYAKIEAELKSKNGQMERLQSELSKIQETKL